MAQPTRCSAIHLTAANFDALDAIESVAAETEATTAQVSLAWLLNHEQVTAPIVGARTPDKPRKNLTAADVELTPERFDAIAQAK